MLYNMNMDRHLNNNLIQLYKKEAEEHEMKRYLEKQMEIQEDKDYIYQREKKESEAEDKIRLDKIKQINQRMCDYNQMLLHLPSKRKSQIGDVIINNYGYNIAGGPPVCQTRKEPQPLLSLFQMNANASYPHREIDVIRKRDKLGNFLTENIDEMELKSYFQNQRKEQVKHYKDMLDTQCTKNQSSPNILSALCSTRSSQELPSSNALINIQNANILKQYKRFALPEEPYNQKRNSPVGISLLKHNPILNPINYAGYNKYINISHIIPDDNTPLLFQNKNQPQFNQVIQWNKQLQHQPSQPQALIHQTNDKQHYHSLPIRKQCTTYQRDYSTLMNNTSNSNQRLIQAGALSVNK